MNLIRHEVSADGSVHTINLASAPGNVIDIAMCTELSEALGEAAASTEAKVLVLAADGKHFSFGASVEEHLPDKAPEMLAALGGVIRSLLTFPYPTVAAVQGSCLGGGLELVLACGIVIADARATLASPEIQLGVIAPAATALLSGRAAEDLLLTGRSVSAEEAKVLGIVNVIAPTGELDETVGTFVERYFVPRSPLSLRLATKAVRDRRQGTLEARLAEAERLYLEELLPTHDGVEGIRAFIDKRPPEWANA
ncbi:MAG: cyclohexa-1,5-dienecarbonyl-CoA hydratase [Actinomycetia bacterium]|nr:cyclohexa-1,5-dienecarbonyl-CoA hydratase [Actinomycetes bacterium]